MPSRVRPARAISFVKSALLPLKEGQNGCNLRPRSLLYLVYAEVSGDYQPNDRCGSAI